MATPVELPQLGNTVEECLIRRWVRQKGDAVAAGDIVAEIETDKTTFEVTAPVAGTVLETLFEEGALVKVFTPIFVIGQPGETWDGAALRTPQSALRNPQPARRSPQSAVRTPQPAWSPRARRFAQQHDFHPGEITGSGPGGRVLERDVRREHAATAVPGSGLRATIARRMRESLAATAQYTLHATARAAGLLALRARLKAAPETSGVTIGDLVAYCTVRALIETPDLNAEYRDGRVVRHDEVHLGFAVDTPRGLMAPVVRRAHTLGVQALAARMKALASKAGDGTIEPDDLAGATFTISNLGGLGIEWFTPVINPPQVAILGVGAIRLEPVRAGGGAVEFADVIGLSLTCDHQAIDGAPGARFLQTLSQKIEGLTFHDLID